MRNRPRLRPHSPTGISVALFEAAQEIEEARKSLSSRVLFRFLRIPAR